MAIAEELTRIQTAKTNIKTAVASKGVTIPDSALISEYPRYINNINVTPCKKIPLRELWLERTDYDGKENAVLTITNFTDDKNLEYSLDETNQWKTYINGAKITIKPHQRIYLRGDNPKGFNKSFESASVLTVDKPFKAGGNIMSLISAKNFNDITVVPDWSFTCLFQSQLNIKSVPDCSNIIVIGRNGFANCFQNSGVTKGGSFTSLTEVNLDAFSYAFSGCNDLAEACEFPVLTTIAKNTFYNAYATCPLLKNAGDYSSITKIDGEAAFYQAFSGTNVTIIKTPNITEWNPTTFTEWLSKIPTTGVVRKPANLTIPIDSDSGVPAGWTVENYDEN